MKSDSTATITLEDEEIAAMRSIIRAAELHIEKWCRVGNGFRDGGNLTAREAIDLLGK